MGNPKEIHLAAERRDAVLQRRINSVIEIGVTMSRKYDIGDPVTIFAGKKPLAEGIISHVYITQVANVIDQLAENMKRNGETFDKKQALENWRKHIKDTKDLNLSPKGSVTIVEWRYL